MVYKISYYKNTERASPIEKYIFRAQRPSQIKIARQLKYLQEYGLNRGVLNLKKIIGYELWEARIIGKANIRIICFQQGSIIHILHIFSKKSQKTKDKDLLLADSRRSEILDR